MSMKEFDIEAAKNGAPVCTRDGRPARILCFDRQCPDYPIVALFKDNEQEDHEAIEEYTANGSFFGDGEESDYDLMMAPIKHEGWVNVYKDGNEYYSGSIYSTEEEAEDNRITDDVPVATIKIEWEE